MRFSICCMRCIICSPIIWPIIEQSIIMPPPGPA
jgi:hypothetical protein